GGTGLDSTGRGVYGLRVESVSQGPLTMRQGAISILGNIAPHGAVVLSSQLGAQLSLTDSTIAVEGTAQCGNDAIGVLLSSSPVRLERNAITAGQASFACGIYLSGTAAEVYGNSIRVGYSNGVTPSCTSNGASDIAGGHAIDVSNTSSLRAIGNTFDPGGVTGQVGPTIGVGLNVGSSAVLSSNIILSGRGPDARLLSAGNSSSPTFTAANITNNHFSNSYASAVSTREWLFDGGVVLNGGAGAGNTFGGTTTCFAAPGVLPDGGAGFPHFLAPGSACTDKGVIGTRTDATAVTLDLFSRPRDGGAGPDIGAVEGP
ncbi:MAG: hypothetical protein JNG84_14440, partial [Archangium sp.]|nr:hypothetical protein [Archangium sp.]